jgi:hypothetical protein
MVINETQVWQVLEGIQSLFVQTQIIKLYNY